MSRTHTDLKHEIVTVDLFSCISVIYTQTPGETRSHLSNFINYLINILLFSR